METDKPIDPKDVETLLVPTEFPPDEFPDPPQDATDLGAAK